MRESLSDISGQVFDVIVIGGGINGASATRCLAEAGYRVLLVEKGDFGEGATSRSTRLIHNGAWYLATNDGFWGNLRKPRLLYHRIRGASDYLAGQTEVRRAYGSRVRGFFYLVSEGGTNPYRLWQMEMGLRAINFATLGRGSIAHRRVDNPEQYVLYRYHHAGRPAGRVLAMDDATAETPERICVDVVLEAEALGAVVVNYARVDGIVRVGSAWSIGIEDRLFETSAEVNATVVVNTAGAWVGEVDAMVSKRGRQRVAPVKGAHILVKTPEFQPGVALLTMTSDRREPFFAMPFRGMYMLGNTHTAYDEDLDEVSVTEQEVEYLLNEARLAFPGAGIDKSSIVYTYSGVRPMSLRQSTWALEAAVHDLGEQEGIPNVITLTGAPVGTFLSVGRRLAAATRKKLLASGRIAGANAGLTRAIPAEDARVAGVPAEPICEHDERTLRDATNGLLTEHAASLADVLRRRTVSVWNECMALHCARTVAETLAPLAGWDAARIDREVARYTSEVEKTFRPRGLAASI